MRKKDWEQAKINKEYRNGIYVYTFNGAKIALYYPIFFGDFLEFCGDICGISYRSIKKIEIISFLKTCSGIRIFRTLGRSNCW